MRNILENIFPLEASVCSSNDSTRPRNGKFCPENIRFNELGQYYYIDM